MSVQALPMQGRIVRLEPFSDALRDEVARALDGDAEAWSMMCRNGAGPSFEAWWRTARDEQAAGKRLPYAVRRLKDQRVVGATSYRSIRPEHRALQIGATYLQAAFRGSSVHPESKLLLLGNAFDAGALRVEFLIDARNERGLAAIRKLGAVPEGVLRQHMVTWNGRVRDTAVFSILDSEWPAVREQLEARLYGEASLSA